jgi:salicylate hydroxylase
MARRAFVAGAGIGGLTAALALARQGFEVEVFERAPALEPFGAGLQLSPNATRALARLGVLDAVRTLALEPRAIRLIDARDGAEFARLPLDGAERRWGAPYLVIHRADLQSALVEAAAGLPNLALSLATEVVDAAVEGAGVVVALKRGGAVARETGELLIGADGLSSRVRARIGFGAADAPPFSGLVAFRAVVDAGRAPKRAQASEVTLRLGAGAHLVCYPLRGGAIVNLVAVIEAARPGDADDRAALDRAAAGWSRDARALIAAAAGNWRAWPLRLRPPLARFSLGPIALVGDAAHPMTPFLAQGAAQAIEDADALERRLAETTDAQSALAAYSRDRVARAARVQRDALMQGRVYHLGGPFAFARDLALAALGPEGMLKRLDWLYAA